MSILALSGSLRTLSTNSALARYAASVSHSIVLAPRLDALPFYDQDVEDVGLPPAVAALRKQAFEASSFLFATPEYNGFTSAVLKNAIDWLSRSGIEGVSPLTGKPFAILSAGGRLGGSRAQKQLIAIGGDFKMTHVGADSPVALNIYDGSKRFEADEGNLTDLVTQTAIKHLVEQLETAAVEYKAKAAATAGRA